MYCLKTKDQNDNYVLPIVWSGHPNKSALQSNDGTLSKDLFTNKFTDEERAYFGFFRYEKSTVPVGKIVTKWTDTESDSYTVVKSATYIDDPDYVAVDPLVERQTQIIADIKREAGQRIVAILPEWKQRNLTAQAAILAVKGQANWTVDEQAEYNAGLALWTEISLIRFMSDELEAIVESSTLETLLAFNVSDNANWEG